MVVHKDHGVTLSTRISSSDYDRLQRKIADGKPIYYGDRARLLRRLIELFLSDKVKVENR